LTIHDVSLSLESEHKASFARIGLLEAGTMRGLSSMNKKAEKGREKDAQ
jgi:hypothetical protein